MQERKFKAHFKQSYQDKRYRVWSRESMLKDS